MSIFWVAVLSLHVLAAVSWIGGMLFLSLVLAPLIRRGAIPGSQALFHAAALRFRLMVWGSITALLTTGPVLAVQRGIPLFDPDRWPEPFTTKLALVALLLLLTATHDLVLGPLVSRIAAKPALHHTRSERRLLRTSRWLPRGALLVALAVLVAAMVVARS